MDIIYTSEQRNEILSTLSEQQRNYLLDKLKRGKRTVFSNELVKGKGNYSGSDQELEQEIQDWEFIELLDAGEGNRSYKCECGMSLRYQYIVKNTQTGEIKKFGKNHFEFHTGIPSNIVKDIIKGFEQIDYELDEILNKIEYGWDLADVNRAITLNLVIPDDIQEQLILGLPLLDKQLARLHRLNTEKQMEIWEQEQKEEEKRIRQEMIQRVAVASTVAVQHNPIVMTEPKQFMKKPTINSPLGDDIHQFIIELIEESGTINVLTICDSIKKFPHNFKGIYNTGKPKCFPVIAQIMEQLVQQGVIKKEQSDFDDRWYSVV